MFNKLTNKNKTFVFTFLVMIHTSYTCEAGISIDTVLVEDYGNHDHPVAGYGAVNYIYRIGTYEVSNTEYAAFLNATARVSDDYGLYNSQMYGISRSGTAGSYSYTVQSGMADKAVTYVSVYDGARFANWLSNGQGSGDTESGVYQLGGVTAPGASALQRTESAWEAGGYALTSLDEWVKAGYYQSLEDGGDADGWWKYPTASNDRPNEDEVNFFSGGGSLWPNGYNGDGDAVESSYYGTYHQGGNVHEWTDATDALEAQAGAEKLQVMGASYLDGGTYDFFSYDSDFLNAEGSIDPSVEGRAVGFRITQFVAVPEPACGTALVGLLCLVRVFLSPRRAGHGTSTS